MDAEHLAESVPGRSLVFSNLAAGDVPEPPFRITFPELSRENVPDAGKRKAPEDAPAALEPLLVEVRPPFRQAALNKPVPCAKDDAMFPTTHADKHNYTESR